MGGQFLCTGWLTGRIRALAAFSPTSPPRQQGPHARNLCECSRHLRFVAFISEKIPLCRARGDQRQQVDVLVIRYVSGTRPLLAQRAARFSGRNRERPGGIGRQRAGGFLTEILLIHPPYELSTFLITLNLTAEWNWFEPILLIRCLADSPFMNRCISGVNGLWSGGILHFEWQLGG